MAKEQHKLQLAICCFHHDTLVHWPAEPIAYSTRYTGIPTMEGTAYHDMAELLRQAALQEAASRAKTRSPLNTDSTAPTSSTPKVSTEAEAEAEELQAVYEDEKAKNDALARAIDERLEALAKVNKSKADEAARDDKRRLELEWQQLEFAIRALEEGKSYKPLRFCLW